MGRLIGSRSGRGVRGLDRDVEGPRGCRRAADDANAGQGDPGRQITRCYRVNIRRRAAGRRKTGAIDGPDRGRRQRRRVQNDGRRADRQTIGPGPRIWRGSRGGIRGGRGEVEAAARCRRSAQGAATRQGEACRQAAGGDRKAVAGHAARGREAGAIGRSDPGVPKACRADRDGRRADRQPVVLGCRKRRRTARRRVRHRYGDVKVAALSRRSGQSPGSRQAKAVRQGPGRHGEGAWRDAAGSGDGLRIGGADRASGKGGRRDLKRRGIHHQAQGLAVGGVAAVGDGDGEVEGAHDRRRAGKDPVRAQGHAARQRPCGHSEGSRRHAAAGEDLRIVCDARRRIRQCRRGDVQWGRQVDADGRRLCGQTCLRLFRPRAHEQRNSIVRDPAVLQRHQGDGENVAAQIAVEAIDGVSGFEGLIGGRSEIIDPEAEEAVGVACRLGEEAAPTAEVIDEFVAGLRIQGLSRVDGGKAD
ncbi:hypothetical protein D3C71_717780 [compost metagenome]